MEDISSSAHLMLNLGAGCTAPPPTPARRPSTSGAADASDVTHFDQSDVAALWASSPGSPEPAAVRHSTTVQGLVGDDGGGGHSSSEARSSSSTPPSKAELDELALYLAQHAFFSTPTLLASPSLRRKREIAACGSAASNESAIATTSTSTATADQGKAEAPSQIGMAGMQSSSTHANSIDGGPCPSSTYGYSTGGFCEESKMGIRRACQEEGWFYVGVADIDNERACVIGMDHLLKQSLSTGRVCVVGACPLVPLSQLIPNKYGHPESKIMSSSQQQDDPFELLLDLPLHFEGGSETEPETLRETMSVFASELVEISKQILMFLLEDICCEARTSLKRHFLKPVLYVYKNGDQEPHVSRYDEDVVLSIIVHCNTSHPATNKGESLIVVLGNHLESWSKGKFKAPTLCSTCNHVDREVCIQLDLVFHL